MNNLIFESKLYLYIETKCRSLQKNNYFNKFMLLILLLNIVAFFLYDFESRLENKETGNEIPLIIEMSCNALFLIEFLIKVISLKLNHYFYSGWNILAFINMIFT